MSKFVAQVMQITFSGPVAADQRKDVLYITERCVFRFTHKGLLLAKVAPGVDIERDILRHLPFRPLMDEPARMDSAIFAP